MRLTSVEAHALSAPVDPPQDRQFHGGHRRLLKRDFVLVVLETADGIQGFAPAGASSSAMREFFEGETKTDLAAVIEDEVAEAITGDAFEGLHEVHDLLDDAALPAAVREKVAGAIDVAVHDIRGKELGVPVYELLLEADESLDTEFPCTRVRACIQGDGNGH